MNTKSLKGICAAIPALCAGAAFAASDNTISVTEANRDIDWATTTLWSLGVPPTASQSANITNAGGVDAWLFVKDGTAAEASSFGVDGSSKLFIQSGGSLDLGAGQMYVADGGALDVAGKLVAGRLALNGGAFSATGAEMSLASIAMKANNSFTVEDSTVTVTGGNFITSGGGSAADTQTMTYKNSVLNTAVGGGSLTPTFLFWNGSNSGVLNFDGSSVNLAYLTDAETLSAKRIDTTREHSTLQIGWDDRETQNFQLNITNGSDVRVGNIIMNTAGWKKTASGSYEINVEGTAEKKSYLWANKLAMGLSGAEAADPANPFSVSLNIGDNAEVRFSNNVEIGQNEGYSGSNSINLTGSNSAMYFYGGDTHVSGYGSTAHAGSSTIYARGESASDKVLYIQDASLKIHQSSQADATTVASVILDGNVYFARDNNNRVGLDLGAQRANYYKGGTAQFIIRNSGNEAYFWTVNIGRTDTTGGTSSFIVEGGGSKIEMQNLSLQGGVGTSASNIVGGEIRFNFTENDGGISAININGSINAFSGVLTLDFSALSDFSAFGDDPKIASFMIFSSANSLQSYIEAAVEGDRVKYVFKDGVSGEVGFRYENVDGKNEVWADVELTSVPEPGVMGAFFGLAAMLLILSRRRA